jgi:hypothetical protein
VLSTEERRHYLTIALRHSERLGKLVAELFELAKLDSGRAELHRETFALCAGAGGSPGVGGEGFVHIHPGIHGIGDLIPAQRDWRNPVAKISIERAP